MRDQVSHPVRTAGKIIILYILIFQFSERRREDRNSKQNCRKYSPDFICS